jgi:vacuolar iron transporter family protein
VSSQADTEKADITREMAEIAADPAEELRVLAAIYEARGVPAGLARQVAEALHEKDALAAHVRDELGMSEHSEARPLTAAGASALTFAVGAALPLATAALVRETSISLWVTVLSLIFLAFLGAVGARAGGAPVLRGVLRVTFWGAVAMAVTAIVGKLFGAVV